MSKQPLSAIADINPPLPRHVHDTELVSFVGMSDVKESGGITSLRDVPFEAVKTGFTRFAEGDVLFAKITPCMENGKGALAVGLTNGIGCGSTEFHVLRAKGENCNGFVYQVVQSRAFRQKAEMNMSGSAGQQRVPSDFFKEFPVHIPDPPQQRRIAEILSTLDEAIEQTEALIAKMQQVKAGLMHDLFTRGVTPDGRLRPTREQAPELYKESPLGWIPREWEVKPCSEICEKITVGIVVRPTQYYVDEGVPAFRSANIRETGVDASDLIFISPQANTLLAKSQVKAGDVISVRTGYPGTSAVVPEEFAGANCVDVLISRPSSSVLPEFLANWINSSFGKDQVLRKQGGLAQQHFNVGELRNLLVVLPEMTEQTAIIGSLATISARVDLEQDLAENLYHQKQGLMHDLLTGRVRVHGLAGVASACSS